MKRELKQLIRHHQTALLCSEKNLHAIYDIMFSATDNVLCESNDGFRITRHTYGQVRARIERAAAGLYRDFGAKDAYIALEMDNSVNWIVAFWAILRSGNKPYLVNLRYPASLTNGILQTLGITHAICEKTTELNAQSILFSSLEQDGTVPADLFADELAFSSSATSMKEVICFYSGKQIAEQILNFKTIIKLEPRMAKHYKGSLKQLAFLPFYHVFGLFAVYFWFTFFGRTLVFLRDYSAETLLKTCRRHQVTHIFAVPMLWHTVEKQVLAAAKEQGEKQTAKLQRGLKLCTAVQNIFPHWGSDLSKRIMKQVTAKLFGPSVMFCISGGSYLRDSALYLLNGIGYSMHNGYGMSEIGITSVELRRKAAQRNQNAIGKPFDSVEYRLDDQGILQVRGTSLCTKKLIDGTPLPAQQWFNTGDVMRRDGDGNYYILGRLGDAVIGENGENINPDTIEQRFDPAGAKAISVLGLQENGNQLLSLVVQINPYASAASVEQLRAAAYAVNDTLPTACRIQRFYFTTDDLCPPTAIKVSRTQLLRKIEQGEVTLTPFSQLQTQTSDAQQSPLLKQVCAIIAAVLGTDAQSIDPNAHLFNDLGATSIQYFSVLTRLSEHFGISDYDKNDGYCYTAKQISDYIERRL